MAELAAAAPPPLLRLLSHPLRWRLATELARSDRRVGELTELVVQPQNLVSYHLGLLRRGGLVSSAPSSHDARDRYYHLDLDACAAAVSETGPALHPALRMTLAPAPPDGRGTPSVLFVCTGNSARSPMAEALLRRRLGAHVHVASAGTHPRDALHPDAVRVLREEYGVDLGAQAPRQLGRGTRTPRYDRVVTLCDKAREVVPTTGRTVHSHWSVADPAAGRTAGAKTYDRFLSTAADIDTRVRYLVPTLGVSD
jgi:protein-tyrosine-phosphatase